MKECPACHRCYRDDAERCASDGDTLVPSLAGEPTLDGRYQLERCLGRGGMGLVFKARHAYLNTSHAVKVVLPDLVGNDPSLLTRFRQEAMAVAAIRHPNVVAVTDFGIAGGAMPFLVMELITGSSLRDILAAEGRLEPARALEMMSAVGAGVAAAHERGILHRDLKPLNIMLREGVPVAEAVKVLDFGLAKIKSGEMPQSFVQAQTTGPMGSPYYMAPEQWSDAEPDYHTDIYSLGVILYQMLAGDVPFKGSSAPSIMNKHLTQEPPALITLGVEVGPALEAVVRRALAKDPSERPASAGEFIDELRDAVAYETLGRTHLGAGEAAARATGLWPVDAASGGPVNGSAVARSDGTSEARLRSEEVATRMLPPAESLPRVEVGPRDGDPTAAPSVAEQSGPRPESVTGGPESTGAQSTIEQQPEGSESPASAPTAAPAGRAHVSGGLLRARVYVIAAAMILPSLGGLVAYTSSRGPAAPAQKGVAERAKTEDPPRPTPEPRTRRDMVEIPGGEFSMGRNDVSVETASPYDLNQWPAHRVRVESFFIDRTEVSGAEYAEFVRESNYQAPEGWVGGAPPPGQEKWPVRNVSRHDAEHFAQWRSRRDGVQYRLPTEAEWEYAARARGKYRLYPWGDRWVDGGANVESESPGDAGSRRGGADDSAPADMIGNVWEWTSTVVSVYPGNRYVGIPPGQKNDVVVRGGSYQSKAVGGDAITATRRQWVPPTTKQPYIGFRLVHDGTHATAGGPPQD